METRHFVVNMIEENCYLFWDETKEAAKHVVDGAVTVGKNVAGVVKKFVSTLVSNGGKDDTDGVKTDEKKGE